MSQPSYLEEAVKSCQDHRHGQAAGINEVECLGHSDEDLIVHPIWNSLFSHPFRHREGITLFHILLTQKDSWDEPDPELNFFRTV